MASRLDDRWLWLGFGVFIFVAAKGIAYGLQEVVDLSSVKNTDISQGKKDHEVEDSIHINTLWTLTKSPNPDIAKSATSILLTRFASDPSSFNPWSDELFSQSPRIRRRASPLLDLFSNYDFFAPSAAPSPPVLDLAGLLSLSLRDETSRGDTIRAAYRASKSLLTQGKELAWVALVRLSSVVDGTGITFTDPDGKDSKILVPEGGVNERNVVHWCRAQRRLLQVHDAQNDAMYLRALDSMRRVARGEEGSPYGYSETGFGRAGRRTEDDCGNPGLRLADDEPGDIGFEEPPPVHRTARFHEESPEEAEVRRRRREVMVLHEGAGVVGRDDIFQRLRSP